MGDQVRKQAINDNVLSEKKTNVLWYSDSPYCATGFGTVARNIIATLDKTNKFRGACIGINDWGEIKNEIFNNFRVDAGLKVGSELDTHVYRFKFLINALATQDIDVFFMLQDTFVMQMRGVTSKIVELKEKRGFQWIYYFPIDGEPFAEWFDGLEKADYLVTYTEWAKKEVLMKRPDLKDKVKVIYHGTNTKEFKPLSDEEKYQFKLNFLGKEFIDCNMRLVSNINRNQPRKDIESTLKAFYLLKKKVPNVVLYLHMKPFDMGGDLARMSQNIGLTIGRDVIFPVNFDENKGFSREFLNGIYNISDIVVSSTTGEGWGLTITEAMSAKVPVVAPYNTSLMEIIGSKDISDTMRGVPVSCGENWNLRCFLTGDNPVLRPKVDVYDFAEKMEWVLNEENREKVDAMIERAYSWISEKTWDNINEKWLDIFMDSAIEAKVSRSNALKSIVRKEMQSANVPMEKVGRNAPCPCGKKNPDGSPKKYKRCCGLV